MLRICSQLVLALLLASGCSAQADIRGSVRVIDGDTLAVAGTTVRLFGIDAPEATQSCDGDGRSWPCGVWAGNELRRLTDGATVLCEPVERDRYGRTVARCAVDGRDLGAELVTAGAAFAYRRYALDYVTHEADARQAGRGLWARGAAETDTPADWRASIRSASSQPAPGACAIKGNISGNGRIYHLPGQRDYERTRIDLARGERWFCTEDQARAAGWRRARR